MVVVQVMYREDFAAAEPLCYARRLRATRTSTAISPLIIVI